MTSYVVFLRGINVGGKNKVPMVDLRKCLEDLGFTDVSTYIASGNVFLRSSKRPAEIATLIERALPQTFGLDSELIKVLVLSRKQLEAIVDKKPKGFGDQADKYHSDAIFLIGVAAKDVMPVFSPREGVDEVWPGDGVVYAQRLSAERTKSRLNKMMASPLYASMTIRNWNTTLKSLELLKQMDESK